MRLFGPPPGRETLFRYLTKYMHQFVISSVAGILYNTVIVLGPILLGHLIDAAGGGTARQVVLSALYFAGVTALFQFARFVKRWYMRDQFNRVACDLRQTLLERTLRRPLPDLEREAVGDLMSRTVGDITMVVDTVMSTLNEGWDTWLLMLSYFAVLLYRDWRITLLASIMVPFTIALAQRMRHRLFDYSMSVRKAAGRANSGLHRYLDGIAVLRLFGRELSEAEEIERSFEQQARSSIREILLQQALLPVYSLMAGLGVVLVVALGGGKVISGEWTVGYFNSFIIMFIAFSGRTRVAARVFNRWHGARAAWSRVQEKMHARTENEPGPEPLSRVTVPTANGLLLNVRSLNFGFTPGQNVLNDISLNARAGQLIGITGAVGSGKTAMAHALTGLYPYEGSISLLGHELSSVPLKRRRGLIAYAGHEQFLFSMPMRENITFGQDDQDDERLHSTLASAALVRDLARFDHGLDTLVGEKGVRVSGGQRQRIALARALHSTASLLLLDDPFSAVDIATEQEIIGHLRSGHAERAVLLFTHRLSALKYADQVLVLDSGRIVEQGTHDELMQLGGIYSEIYAAQMFLEGDSDATTGQ
ncbi:MAG TPA: ABC transporter ATP-binding protein [Bacillota bacterium]|nr:ABC transporter ATP-binding protein [Bacillota bacterium]